MDNRGSKSVTFLLNNLTVKEQRVNGNLYGVYTLRLRYTLMGFERNYQIIIPSNQTINKLRSYTSLAIQENLKPNFKIDP